MAAYSGKEEHDAWLQAIEDSEVLVVYDEEDRYEVTKTVLNHFDKEEVSYIHPEADYQPGKIEMESVGEAIRISRKVLLILSESSVSKPYSLEMYLALEKSLQEKHLCVTILTLRGFDHDKIPNIPMLQNATMLRMDYNQQERCLNQLIKHIRAETPLDQVLPAGNFSTGLAWSHYTGYLRILLPSLPNMIRESEWYRNNPGHFPVKFFILLPWSAQTDPLTNDTRIANVGHLVVKAEVAGAPRTYTPQVYRVSTDDGKDYFCCAEVPSAFGMIGEVFHERLCYITPSQRSIEVERFKHKLEEILNHQLNDEHARGVVEIIDFDDEAKKEDIARPSYHLEEKIRHNCSPTKPPKENKPRRKVVKEVCLLYAECDADQANKVRYTLEDKGMKGLSKVVLPREDMVAAEERIKSASWILLFVSESALTMSECMPIWMAGCLSCGIEQDQMRVLPILIDAAPNRLPSFIRWVTYLSIKEEGYQNRIWDIINGKPISMKSQIPVGNVAYGLAWAFFYNYLRHALPELPTRCKQKMLQIGATKSCVPRLFEFVPHSCKFVDKLNKIETHTFGIESLGAVGHVKATVAGIGRIFDVNMYAIYKKDSHPREYVHYFMGEYAAPVKTLRHMHETMISGLNNHQMFQQAVEFTEELHRILGPITDGQPEYAMIKGMCIPILFDDSKDHLINVLIKEIANQEKIEETKNRMGGNQ